MLLPRPITFDRLDIRFSQLVEKLRSAMVELEFPSEEVLLQTDRLRVRLANRDYVNRSSRRASEHLHTAKRVTRFFIVQAILTCPAHVERVALARKRYSEQVAREREANPCSVWFSFETVHAALLKPDTRRFAHLFRLGPVD